MKTRSKSPLIGVTPDVSSDSGDRLDKKKPPVIFLHERYTRALMEAGATPVILPITPSARAIRDLIDRLDGLVVSGGNFDIDPEHYGEEPVDGLGEIKKGRTDFELDLISLALKRDVPLLGICGGAQAINVALGGSLYQDIATQLPSAGKHERGELKEEGGHTIRVHDGTRLRAIVRREALEVNTTHHQAVKALGKGLIINATAEDGVIEGIESREHSFVLGVQWHPEFLTGRDDAQRRIFAALARSCTKQGAGSKE